MQVEQIKPSAIVLGVFAALVTQIILNMAAAGAGLASISGEIDRDKLWTAFAVWAVAGIIAAFVGGRVAGMLCSRIGNCGFHGLATWAAATVIVVAGAIFAGGTGAAFLAGPAYGVPSSDDPRSTMGALALASAIALLIGAVASFMGARTMRDTTTQYSGAQPRPA
jgi:hypothetical protein